MYHANRKQKRMGVDILIKVSIYQEDITIIDIYAPNNRPSKYVKQKLTELKGEINSPMIIIEAINTSLSIMGKTTRQKISKEIEYLNNILN